MFDFETTAPAGHEAERVTTAFYRFLELRPAPQGAVAQIRTEPMGAHQRHVVSLWSAEALHEFRRYLDQFKTHRPTALKGRLV